MPFPFRAVVLSGAVALVPVTGATAQNEEPQPPTMEQGPGLTPMDQGSSPSDVKITQEIRRALTSTQGFSVDARNVKIITRDGAVTLRGQVKDDSERAAVVAAAKRTPGVTHVDQDLQLQPMDRGQRMGDPNGMNEPNSMNDPNRMYDPNGTQYRNPNEPGTMAYPPGSSGNPPGTPPVGSPPPSTTPPGENPQPGTGLPSGSGSGSGTSGTGGH
jgi:hypothetical protein